MRLRNAGPGALFLSFLFSFLVPVRHRVIHSVCKKRAPPQKSPGSTLVLCRVKLTHQFGRWPTGRHSAARRRSRVQTFLCMHLHQIACLALLVHIQLVDDSAFTNKRGMSLRATQPLGSGHLGPLSFLGRWVFWPWSHCSTPLSSRKENINTCVLLPRWSIKFVECQNFHGQCCPLHDVLRTQ